MYIGRTPARDGDTTCSPVCRYDGRGSVGVCGEKWVDPSSRAFDAESGSGVSLLEDDEDVTFPVPVPVPEVDLLVNVEDVGTVVPKAERFRVAFFLADEVVVDMMMRSICDARLSDESLRRSSGLDAAAVLFPPVTPGAIGAAGPDGNDGEDTMGG